MRGPLWTPRSLHQIISNSPQRSSSISKQPCHSSLFKLTQCTPPPFSLRPSHPRYLPRLPFAPLAPLSWSSSPSRFKPSFLYKTLTNHSRLKPSAVSTSSSFHSCSSRLYSTKRQQSSSRPPDFSRRIIFGIIALNCIVYATWHHAKITENTSRQLFLSKHFVSSLENLLQGRWWTLITPLFLHIDTMSVACAPRPSPF